MVSEAEGVSINSMGLEAKMVSPPAPPPPAVNSITPRFKTNSSCPNPNHAPALLTPIMTAPHDVVFGVVANLRERGRLIGLEISEVSEFPLESLPTLFNLVVIAYLADVAGARSTVVPLVPPPPIKGGHKVELLRLFLAVRLRGGFRTVGDDAAWEEVTKDMGLDPSAHPEVKLMYGDYLADLELCIRDLEVVDQEMVDINHDAGQSSKSMEDEIVSVTIDRPPIPWLSLKRKREAMVGTLNWMRMVAESPDEPMILKENYGGHASRVVHLRDLMYANVDCSPLSSWKVLTGMLDWVRNVASNPDELGVITGTAATRYLATAVQVRARMFALDEKHGLPRVDITQCDEWDDKRHFCGLADIPEWTGKPSLPYEDSDALRFLGEPILTPESNLDPYDGSIGKGRQDDWSPGSIYHVRACVAEKWSELNQQLGPAFSQMGFDRMGEHVALTWTVDEETIFSTTIQQNRASSKLWKKLRASLHYKTREDIVSYYYNVYLVRQKAHLNWFAPNYAGSDYDPLA